MGPREPIFRLLRSLIFDALLVWKRFNFLVRPRPHFVIVIMYVEVKFTKNHQQFLTKTRILSILGIFKCNCQYAADLKY